MGGYDPVRFAIARDGKLCTRFPSSPVARWSIRIVTNYLIGCSVSMEMFRWRAGCRGRAPGHAEGATASAAASAIALPHAPVAV